MELRQYIEHTLLKPDAKKEELDKLFEEAKKYGFLGVCVNPINVEYAKKQLEGSGVKIVTVVGFPLGASLSGIKAFEAKRAIEQGADEVDMVICVQALKNKDYKYVLNDIKSVKSACGQTPLKVIIETDLLEKDEIKKACQLIIDAKADFAKTSTGFVKNGVGAKVEDVEIMAQVLKGSKVKIKASGGIKDREKAEKLIQAGAVRLGTSSGVKLVEG
ncbi:deoxyribose-phosphate aldolase [bacterium]|nr:deoxyribose-phosphate aldolase [bacterium]